MIKEESFGGCSISNAKETNKSKNIYHVITGITAVVTDVIAPWLEVVIILLPDVISLLKGIFGESDSQIVKRRFVNNVVPQIINKMYTQIKQNVETTTKRVLDEYEKMLTEKIETIKKNIIDAQEKKEKRVKEFDNYKTEIYEDIVSIQKMLSELG